MPNSNTGRGSSGSNSEKQQGSNSDSSKSGRSSEKQQDQSSSKQNSPGSTRGGTHEQHVQAGQQSHKNS